jgi:hypothetical protein
LFLVVIAEILKYPKMKTYVVSLKHNRPKSYSIEPFNI